MEYFYSAFCNFICEVCDFAWYKKHYSTLFFKDAIVIFPTPVIFPSQTWHKEKNWMKLHDSIPCITLFAIAQKLIVVHTSYFQIFVLTHWGWYMQSMNEIEYELNTLLHSLIISSNKTVTYDLHHVLTSTCKIMLKP